MKVKYDRFYYKPLPEEVYIDKSKIEGHGIFASCEIKAKHDLGSTHIKVPMIVGYIRTPLGGFINHSEKPNCFINENIHYHDGWQRELYTTRPIKAGEELTVYYTLQQE